jgi:hypothetical protein
MHFGVGQPRHENTTLRHRPTLSFLEKIALGREYRADFTAQCPIVAKGWPKMLCETQNAEARRESAAHIEWRRRIKRSHPFRHSHCGSKSSRRPDAVQITMNRVCDFVFAIEDIDGAHL